MHKKNLHPVFLIALLFAFVAPLFSPATAFARTIDVCVPSGTCIKKDFPDNIINSYTAKGFLTCRGDICVAQNSEILTRMTAGEEPTTVKDTTRESSDFFGIRSAITWVMSWILAIPVLISGLFLWVAGILFDGSLTFSIIDFSTNYTQFFAGGVEQVWISFRDIGNIVMIGVFVYIAFRTILGVESFGMKSFAARLVIVAVLINFSLFFTKVIIDISNITATQFTRSIGAGDNGGSTTYAKTNIAETFANRAGIKSLASTSAQQTINGIATNDGLPSGAAIRYVIFTTIFFLAVGSVLLHGAILLITRMIAFIILMITSPVAWVAFMTPKLEKYWSTWWDKMTKYAIFAPLYMVLIWSVLKITEGMAKNTALTADSPAFQKLVTSGDWFTAAMNVAIIVGLLYAATKIADELSIAGASFAKNISLKGLRGGAYASGLTLPISAALGVAGLATRQAASLAQNANKFASQRTGGFIGSARLDKQLEDFKKKQFDLANTTAGKAFGFKKSASTQEKADFLLKNMDEKNKAAAKSADTALKAETQKPREQAATEKNAGAPISAARATKEDVDMVRNAARKGIQEGEQQLELDLTGGQMNSQGTQGAVSETAKSKASQATGVDDQKIRRVAQEVVGQLAQQAQPSQGAVALSEREIRKAQETQRATDITNIVDRVMKRTPEQRDELNRSLAEKAQSEQASKLYADAAKEITRAQVEAMRSSSLKEAMLKTLKSGGKSDVEQALAKFGEQIKNAVEKPAGGGGGGTNGPKIDTTKVENKLDTLVSQGKQERKDRLNGI